MKFELKCLLFFFTLFILAQVARAQDVETGIVADEEMQSTDSIEPILNTFLFGDINSDGEVSAEDFSIFVKTILHKDSTFASNSQLMDWNADGVVSISDLSYVIDYLNDLRSANQQVLDQIPGLNLCYNLENRLVKDYLDLADQMYSDGIGRSGVSALNYIELGLEKSYFLSGLVEYPDDTASWEEQPAPVAFPVSHTVSQVTVSESPFFADSLTFVCNGDSAIIYNLIPDRIYWYRCYDDTLGLVDNGLFKTKGRVRMLACPNVRNVRDAGGWPCDGGHLAYGKLLRSGTLEFIHANDENEKILRHDIGLSYDMDLRHAVEAEDAMPDFSSNMAYGNFELFAYMWLLTGRYWSESAKTVKTSSCRIRFGEALKQFAVNLESGLCTDAHCSGGADRTGMFCFVVGALCGVSEADLVKDWELTSFTNYFKWIDLERNTYYIKSGTKYVQTGAEMRSVCKYLYDNFGGKDGASLRMQVEGWLSTFMGDVSRLVSRLRQQLIVPDVKSPLVVRDVSALLGAPRYTLTADSTALYPAQKFKCLDASGAVSASPLGSITDYIDCTGFSHLLVNRIQPVVGAYYDDHYNYISSIVDDTLSEQETSNCEYLDYLIPETARYVRFNLMKDSNITAVLSEESYVPND